VKPDLIREKVRTVLFMAAVTFVAITLVGLVDMVTKDTVARNKTIFEKQAVADASGMQRFASVEALLQWYAAHVTAVTNAGGALDHCWVRRGAEAEPRSLVLVQKGPGLWGGITVFVGFEANAAAIRGVTFQDHVETPGLGARIDEPWFRRQFAGKSGPFAALGPEPKDKTATTPDNDKFDQITGATITSTAVKDIMNKSIERAKALSAVR